jgi:hypothetical protein
MAMSAEAAAQMPHNAMRVEREIKDLRSRREVSELVCQGSPRVHQVSLLLVSRLKMEIFLPEDYPWQRPLIFCDGNELQLRDWSPACTLEDIILYIKVCFTCGPAHITFPAAKRTESEDSTSAG